MAKNKPKSTYNEMIQESLMMLDNKTGATRQDIWKCVQKNHENVDIKQFNKKLVNITKEDKLAHFKVQKMPKNRARFRLDVDFAKRVRSLQAKQSNESLTMAALFNLAGKSDKDKTNKKEKAPVKQDQSKQKVTKDSKVICKKKEPVKPKIAAKKGRKVKESSDMPSQKVTTPRQMKNAQKKRENLSLDAVNKQNISKVKGPAKNQKKTQKSPQQNGKVGNTKKEINKGSAKKSIPKSKKSKAIKKK